MGFDINQKHQEKLTGLFKIWRSPISFYFLFIYFILFFLVFLIYIKTYNRMEIKL